MHDRLRFGEVYRRLADDELAGVALSGHLVPEAQEALAVELERRGLTDLSQYKHTKVADTRSLGSDPQFQGRLKQVSSDRVIVFAAWALAVSIPLTFLSAEPLSSAILIRLCLVGALIIAVSCYRGLSALRGGSRKGFALKFLLPLILLGTSVVVVFFVKLRGFSL